jgi:uncharacterized protein involved in exopolysaccharide biosynthesis
MTQHFENEDRSNPVEGDHFEHADQELSLLDLLIVLAKRKRLVIGVPIVAAVAAAVITLFMPNLYTATTKILPPQQGYTGATAALAQLNALAGLAGAASLAKNPSDLYLAMLKSRTIADKIIERHKLKDIYGTRTLTSARKTLWTRSEMKAGKEGVITIDVDDRDPKRAAELANAFVDELYQLTQTLAVSEASQRRLFFEKQMKAAKTDLAAAEVELRKTQEATGLIRLDEQGKAIIESLARLQATVAAKEVQLGAMRTFATESNPDVIMAQNELVGLRAQLAKSERDQKLGGGNILVPTGKIPEAGLEYVRKLRDVKYSETMFELLAKQFELAKIDEARDGSLVQVLESAIEPEEKSKPWRTMIVLVTGLAAGVLAILMAFIAEALDRARNDPRTSERFGLLRRHLARRGRRA